MRGGRDECLVQFSNVSFLLCGEWEMRELTSSLIRFQRIDSRALTQASLCCETGVFWGKTLS